MTKIMSKPMKTDNKQISQRTVKKVPKQKDVPAISSSEEQEEMESSPAIEEVPIKNITKDARGRKKKYSTPEEAHAARLEQMRQWRERRKMRVISINTPNTAIKDELMEILSQATKRAEMTPELRECLEATLQLYPKNEIAD